MAPPEGNSFWRRRLSHGRSTQYPDAETLWASCVQYFDWVEANPLLEWKAFSFQGAVTVESVPRMRAMTVSGLCVHLGISPMTWSSYRERPEFAEIAGRADAVIRTQKFEGAAADLLNPAIIARDLGLADKAELTGANGGPVALKLVGHRQRAQAVAAILARGVAALKDGDNGESGGA